MAAANWLILMSMASAVVLLPAEAQNLIYKQLQQFEEGNDRIELDSGSNTWYLLGNHTTGEIKVKATVPGDVYTDLKAAGLIADPILDFNDERTRWVAYQNWTYATEFVVDAIVKNSNRQLDLVLEGVDTIADVMLNGNRILSCDNFWRQYRVNVNDLLNIGSNHLQLHFTSPVTYAASQSQRQIAKFGFNVPPQCPPSSWHGECHFNFIRKPAYSFAWDWGPAVPTSGIWRSLYIEQYNGVTIDFIKFSAHPSRQLTPADAALAACSRSSSSSSSSSIPWQSNATVGLAASDWRQLSRRSFCLVAELPELNARSEFVCRGGAGQQKEFVLAFTNLRPRLWWPNGYGEQQLYNLTVTLCSDGAACRSVSHVTQQVGFRSISLQQKPVSTGSGLTFNFVVNGRRIFARGANLVPLGISIPSASSRSYWRLLADAAATGITLLRVWGGGTIERTELYNAADRLGLMLWQDLPFACSLYPTDAEFLATVAAETRSTIRRLQHHPSIAVWAGNNENEAAIAENWWPFGQHKLRYMADYRRLYLQLLLPLLREEDPSAAAAATLLASSPSNGDASLKQGGIARDPQSSLFGDVHYYNYTADLWNTSHLPVARFVSEFGQQSLPSLLSLLAASSNSNSSSNIGAKSEFMQHRQHQQNGTDIMLWHTHLHFADRAPSWLPRSNWENLKHLMVVMGIGPDRNGEFSEDLHTIAQYTYDAYSTQCNQAALYQLLTEWQWSHSCQLLPDSRGLSAGVMFWQLNDVWTAPTWSTIEHSGVWKPAQHYARRYYGNRRVLMLRSRGEVVVQFVQEAGCVPKRVVLQFTCLSFDSFVPTFAWNVTAVMPSSESNQNCPQPLLRMTEQQLLQRCRCRSEANCLLRVSDSGDLSEHLFFTLPKHFVRGVLPSVNWTITAVQGQEQRAFDLDLTTRTPVYSLHVQFVCQQLASARFSDNSFHLSQPHRQIRFVLDVDVSIHEARRCLLLHFL